MKKDAMLLLLVGGVIVFFTLILSPVILPIFMKDKYALSIPVLRIIIFALPLILLNSVFYNALYVLRRSWVIVFLFLSQAIINFLLNYIFIPRYSYIASSYITVFSEAINFMIVFFVFLTFYKRRLSV